MKIKHSKFALFLVKLGIRRLTVARRIYGFMMKTNTNKPINIDEYKIFIDDKDSMGLLQRPDFYSNNSEVDIMKEFVKEGDVVIDLGANIGVYTLLLAKLVGKAGKVYSFEPDSENFKILVKNIIINGYKNITPINKAVSNKTGRIKLYLSEWNKGDHRIYSSDEKRKFKEIRAVSLDDYFLGNKEEIKFVKMDIQGAEAIAFDGGKSFFNKKQPIVLQEFWPVGIESSGKDYKEFLEFINSKFKIYSEHNIKKEINPEEILSIVSVKRRNHMNLLCIPK